jgi:hypothetical protein
MIEKEYVKEVISRITELKAEKNMVPAAASMQEVMASVRDDVLECLRTMYGTKEVVANKTLNSVSFKCL